jgi:type II secretory pathway pseudopilin PulG
MSWKLSIRLAELLVSAILALALVAAWRAEHNDRAQLAAELSAAKQALAQADARQHDRDTQLLQTLSTLAVEKRTITTPEQIVRDLPHQIALPAPMVLQPAATEGQSGTKTQSNADPRSPSSTGSNSAQPQAQAVIPAEDLKPLYDFTIDCKACQAKLSASQGDLTDEKAKVVVLTKERDEAVRAAKGGSVLERAARAAKWLIIGAALGAVASRAAH